MRWDEAVDQFTSALKLARKSPHTIASYLSDLRLAIDYWIGQRQRLTVLDDVTTLSRDDIADWLFFLHQKQQSARTIQRRRASLKLFLAYLVEQGWIPESPYPESRVIQPTRKATVSEIIYLSEDQVTQLMKTVQKGFPQDLTWIQRRDEALFWLLLGTGLRVSEACGLTRAQVRDGLTRGSMSIVGKGEKRRQVALPQAIQEPLTHYDRIRPATAVPQFFVTQRRIPRGQEFPVTPLAPREVQRRIHRYATEAQLGLPLTPHKMRHTYATALLATGVDIRVVQEALGHAHLSTTEIYTHVRIEAQRYAVDHIDYLKNKPQ